jgi:putative endopeptidase
MIGLARLSTLFLLASASVTVLGGPASAEPPRLPFNAWGFDHAGQDTSVRPGDDFNAYVNGRYLAQLTIPDDRSSYGIDAILTETTQQHLRSILESTAAAAPADAADTGKIRDLYAAFMDQARVEALGASPLADDVAALRAAGSREDLARLMGSGVRGFQPSLFALECPTGTII